MGFGARLPDRHNPAFRKEAAADRRPQVLLVAPRYLAVSGGVERHVQALAERVARRGFDVHVAATDPTGRLPPHETHAGVEIHRFPTLFRDATFHVSPSLTRWLIASVARFDLVHAHSYHSPVVVQAAIAARVHKRPLILTTHFHGSGHSPVRRMLHVPYRVVAGSVLRSAVRVVCVSEAERRHLLKSFGPAIRTVVIPNGTQERQSSAAPFAARPQLVLAVSRLERYKQLDQLLRGIALLPSDVRLRVIGTGPEESSLRRLAATLGISERIEFRGYLGEDELDAAYADARVVVSMSRHEAFGLTLLEGAAAGASIVASDIEAHREVLTGSSGGPIGSLVPFDATPEMVADSIRLALQAPNSANASLATWDDMSERVVTLYREVLAGTMRPRAWRAAARAIARVTAGRGRAR